MHLFVQVQCWSLTMYVKGFNLKQYWPYIGLMAYMGHGHYQIWHDDSYVQMSHISANFMANHSALPRPSQVSASRNLEPKGVACSGPSQS